MSRMFSSDGRIRPPVRVVGVMACVMMTLWSVVIFTVTQASHGFSVSTCIVWAGWLAFMWGLMGWPAMRGREHRWMADIYYATWGRLLGDYRLKKK